MRTARNHSKDRGARFEAWFRTVVIRKALTMRRQEARRNVRRLAAGDDPAARESVDVFMMREEAERALEAVKDEDDRLAYTLKRRDGFSYEEIAKAMGQGDVNAAAWKTRVLRAGQDVDRAIEARTRR